MQDFFPSLLSVLNRYILETNYNHVFYIGNLYDMIFIVIVSQFVCKKNLQYVFLLHILLHIFLNITESRKQVPCSARTSQLVLTGIRHTAAEANTCTWATAGARF